MKKVNKRIIAFFMLVLTLFSSCSNLVFATEINSANLTTIQDSDSHIQFNFEGAGWTNVRTNYVGYYENGTIYPAYCITHGAPGVDEIGDYTVSIERTLDDVRLWRAIINGFPYKTAAQLGVENDLDAYVATKQAVYCIILGRDVLSNYRGIDARGQKIVNAMNNIVNEGRYGTQTPQSGAITATKSGSFYEEGNYYVQKFNVSSAVEIGSYNITATANLPSGAIITNSSGTQTNSFNGNESFYIKVPKSSLGADINAVINIQGRCKTYPVFYGNTPIAGAQDYAVTYDPFGDGVGRATLDIKTNTGKLSISKIDDETKQPIEGVTFKLMKNDGTVVARATTNSNGIATFTGLYQQSYKLVEESTNVKYILNSVEFNVDIKYNKTTNMTVENEHKKGNLKIYKVDKDNHKIALGNVKFDLYSEEFKKVLGTYTTSVDGEIQINNLRIRKLQIDRKKYSENGII